MTVSESFAASRRILRLDLRGGGNLAYWQQAVDGAAEDLAASGARRLLLDLRAVHWLPAGRWFAAVAGQFAVATRRGTDAGATGARQDALYEALMAPLAVAFLVANPGAFAVARTFQAFAEQHRMPVLITTSEAEAARWLQQQPERLGPSAGQGHGAGPAADRPPA